MEGINASGIRKVVGAPRRYAVPLIVSTGTPADDSTAIRKTAQDRYPMDEVVYSNSFGVND